MVKKGTEGLGRGLGEGDSFLVHRAHIDHPSIAYCMHHWTHGLARLGELCL
jgi:hypothetical protein